MLTRNREGASSCVIACQVNSWHDAVCSIHMYTHQHDMCMNKKCNERNELNDMEYIYISGHNACAVK